jgi:hypothetical protein
LRQAAAVTVPAYDKKVSAVVLLDEQRVTVDDEGRVTTVRNYAVKVLSREGREDAIAVVGYNTDFEKVKDLKAWLIRPSGDPKRYSKDRVLDIAAEEDDVYNEARVRAIMAMDDAEPGAVFGFESTVETRSVFTQDEWPFQEKLPVLTSRYILALPSGWRAESVTFNHAKVEPSLAATTYTWELRNLPLIEEEPGGPAMNYLAARIAVSYFPPFGRSIAGRTFTKWGEVSQWLSELSDPQAVANDSMSAKAQSLVTGLPTELEKIRAIGRFVQNVHYISIQTGLGRGGGYKPHSAVDVFAKSYGDCKDKANLMRAMLKSIGITSYPVSICSGDPLYVREEWPSPHQFNHCIIAIKVKDDTQAPTIIKHPALGRLLIFDPTDDDTPVGDLPDHEQGSFALVIAGDLGSLTRMPVTPPEANRLRRDIDASLGADGALTATLKERAEGQAAVNLRRTYHHLQRPEYAKYIERWVSRGANAASVSKLEPSDDIATGRFGLELAFSSASYGQVMQGRLLVFKPAVVSRLNALMLTAATRNHPVLVSATAFDESVRIKLPAGFDVDEMPDPVKLDAPFGKYSVSYEVKDGYLIFNRSLVTQGTIVPAAQYQLARGFFERIRAAEQSPVVLAKK